ncbi:hypothetical protein [Enterococcus alishanensis]
MNCRESQHVIFSILMLQAGVPVQEVSEPLSHKDVKITSEIYSHIMPEEAEKTADKFAQFVGFKKSHRPFHRAYLFLRKIKS